MVMRPCMNYVYSCMELEIMFRVRFYNVMVTEIDDVYVCIPKVGTVWTI